MTAAPPTTALISVDTKKKKELVGTYRNPGAKWDRSPELVNDHDFRSDADGLAVPYGIYDPRANAGTVFVGRTADTPAFAVDCIEKWWRSEGHKRYPGAKTLQILADGGGSNSCTARAWTFNLQHRLCNRHELAGDGGPLPAGPRPKTARTGWPTRGRPTRDNRDSPTWAVGATPGPLLEVPRLSVLATSAGDLRRSPAAAEPRWPAGRASAGRRGPRAPRRPSSRGRGRGAGSLRRCMPAGVETAGHTSHLRWMQSPTDPADRTGTIGVDAFDATYRAGFQASDDSPHALDCELVEGGEALVAFVAHRPTDTDRPGRVALVDGTLRTGGRLTCTGPDGDVSTGPARSCAAGAVLVAMGTNRPASTT